ncbi:MAG: PepSY domain-containing protein [Pseudomonadota bacterium]
MKLKRCLFLTHRWLGVGMCLLFAMWFLSGVVMMYVHFPSLTLAERLSGLPAIDGATVRYFPQSLLSESPRSLRLTTLAGRPAWLAQSPTGKWHGVFADSGEAFAGLDASGAKMVVQLFLSSSGQENAAVGGVNQIEMDQWTVSGSLNSHRPLFQVHINDEYGTDLYVSSQTGEVVRDTTRRERAWNWLGANLHWIYPLALRRHPVVWHWVVVVLSSIGLFSIITGLVVGVIRLRPKRPYRGRDWTPYRGIMKWHHVLGLTSTLFLFTFMLSGLLSMNPGSVFSSPNDYSALAPSYQSAKSGQLDLPNLEVVRKALRDSPGVKEIRWHWLNGVSSPVMIRSADDYQLLDEPSATMLEQQIIHSANRALRAVSADAKLLDVARLDNYDSYYYSHAGRWRPLPIFRLRYDDLDRSWLHVDARTGELLSHLTSYDRAERWWYHGLHSLDFNVLINNRPLWDIVMLALSMLGGSMALTSIVIGWRRLRPHRRSRTSRRDRDVGFGDAQQAGQSTIRP